MCVVAITGITGLAGGAVSRRLRHANHEIVGISRRDIEEFDGFPVRSVPDFSDATAFARALRGCDAVLHFADRADRKSYTEANVDAASEAMHAIRIAAGQLNLSRLVAMSSVYAGREPSARDFYGLSKRRMEAVALAPDPGLPAAILRLPPLYGAGAKGSVGHIARAARAGIPLPFALAKAPRRFLGLDDLGELCLAILSLDQNRFAAMQGHIYYPSSARGGSLSALARLTNTGRTHLIAVPGIDHLIPGAVSAKQISEEREALTRATGWDGRL
ncbi:NAD-dependent epimerase/dehydratase family protein [Sphingomonas sp. 7/4-4]|uniref:NAD-dependent epimerase/dehydratase family protein n=1 Tax=Sphingomonas sp. 7/4-4 TaxID=3018446 RepID=UPI0022F3E0D4|nr:NAD-dependent epimerase/dehydratase family protein [Sphingomonas sp. 7/4-4]WBY07948.1 NAD-dependent epimerase/dehydratase family protein [Sphingomonas sp. 7/4-4]